MFCPYRQQKSSFIYAQVAKEYSDLHVKQNTSAYFLTQSKPFLSLVRGTITLGPLAVMSTLKIQQCYLYKTCNDLRGLNPQLSSAHIQYHQYKYIFFYSKTFSCELTKRNGNLIENNKGELGGPIDPNIKTSEIRIKGYTDMDKNIHNYHVTTTLCT